LVRPWELLHRDLDALLGMSESSSATDMFKFNGQNNSNMKGSNVCVWINTLTQVYYMIALRDPNPRTWQAKLTNIVNITFAGVYV
jgi:hypothetical protein